MFRNAGRAYGWGTSCTEASPFLLMYLSTAQRVHGFEHVKPAALSQRERGCRYILACYAGSPYPSPLPIGRDVCHTVATFDRAKSSFANHHSRRAEMRADGFAPWIVDKMDLAAGLTGFDHVP
jgi:hypothetical protein